jgi:hypothetical protein
MWTYFDTSALVKRYVEEAGRGDVLQLLRRNDLVTSAVLPMSVSAAASTAVPTSMKRPVLAVGGDVPEDRKACRVERPFGRAAPQTTPQRLGLR